MNRYDASTIFKARTRMLDVKNNYRNKHANNLCRACKEEIESQEHILEKCKKIHDNNQNKVNTNDIFENNIESLKRTAEKVRINIDRLTKCSSP